MKMASEEQHGVAIAKEAIALTNGFSISVQEKFAAASFVGCGKGADQHEQGRAGEMKVRQEHIHDFEVVGRIDEDPRPAPARLSSGGELRQRPKAFQDAEGGGADCHDAAAFAFSRSDE